jgi:two-component system sensor histidine kinase QseC
VLGLVTIVWLGAAILTWYDTRHELDELLDGHLAQAAALLVVRQAHADGDEDDLADAPSLHKYAPQVAFQVFSPRTVDDTFCKRGNGRPMASITRGFATVQLPDNTEWRVFSTHGAENDVQVYVGERTSSRKSILWAVLRSVLFPLIFALPILTVALWWAVRKGISPLRQLSHVLGQRRAQALEPVVLANMPLEMQPVVKALNGLV